MNWDAFEQDWKQLAGHAQKRWSKLTDDDLKSVAGRRAPLSGKIQERYGVGSEEVEKQMVVWEKTIDDTALGKGRRTR